MLVKTVQKYYFCSTFSFISRLFSIFASKIALLCISQGLSDCAGELSPSWAGIRRWWGGSLGQALAPLTIKTSVDREPREMKKNEESI